MAAVHTTSAPSWFVLLLLHQPAADLCQCWLDHHQVSLKSVENKSTH
jgi:hypothetical protein